MSQKLSICLRDCNYYHVQIRFIKLILNAVGFSFGAWSSGDEKTIRSTIFSTASYDRLTRPDEITNVSVAFNLLAINTLEWEDSRLTWTVTAGTESNYVFATNTEIWFPEIFLDNSLADVNVIANEDLLFRVKFDGKVDWEIPRIFTTYCEVDVTYFPFDTQTCTIEVTSWVYTMDEMKLYHLKTEVNIEDFKQHGEFLFKSSSISSAQLQETKADGTIEYFSKLNYNLILERRPSYYIMSMILPVVLTSYLMIIVFILPVHSGEKVGFSLTVLLAVAVLLTLILDQMPSTALYVSIFHVSND
ncbi:hypothetical protein KUTeg_003180 [Tegillarca granosa]|uniref:Uncharacterized protein n=1 Tax=Tegillarca granosa TaxID=220873 RepID=A0ABQ9FLE9_TEGGR|nr:hypothetical protein KUTeg_003180 [Tegillarca granosa]